MRLEIPWCYYATEKVWGSESRRSCRIYRPIPDHLSAGRAGGGFLSERERDWKIQACYSGRTVHLTAEPESDIGTEDGLFYISVTHSDQNGITAACMDSMVSVAESENIQLLGFGNGDPKPLYHYLDAAVPTFHGRALLVVEKQIRLCPGTSLNLPSGT